MKDDTAILTSDPAAHVELLLDEYKQAGTVGEGGFDLSANRQARRMVWPGQSADGRKWDKNMPQGEVARPWNGCSDTRVPVVDAVCNDDTAVNCVAFQRADLRATAVDPRQAGLAGSVSAYLHWMVHTRYRAALRPQVERSTQYSREYGWCVAYVGWERELSRKRRRVTVEDVAGFVRMQAAEAGQAPGEGEDPAAGVLAMLLDPAQEAAAIPAVQALYREFARRELEGRGLYADELSSERVQELSPAGARRALRELREEGATEVPMAYVAKNQALCRVLMPQAQFLAARGTVTLQGARALFWRDWLSEGALEAKKAEGWDPDWVEAVKKTKGQMSLWGEGPSGTTPGVKQVGATTWTALNAGDWPGYEVVYAFVKKVDEDGVTAVYQTVFSPHLTRREGGAEEDFYAKHELVDYAQGEYPFVLYKREEIGEGITDTRSVAEVAGTWQAEEKCQRDMLFNRAQWDTMPPVKVGILGGVGLRLGPGAEVPLRRNESVEALTLGAPAPSLALELVQMLRLQTDKYFGQFNPELHPALVGVKQEKAVGDFYAFWGEVLLRMFGLTVAYNLEEVVAVAGDEEVRVLGNMNVLEQFQVGLEFDVQELNPDYLMKKLEAVHERLLPGDTGGVTDRAALTQLEWRMLDRRLAAQVAQDRGAASQKVFREVDMQVARMALGNEAEYTENDPAAPMKLQFLEQVLASNPKYQGWLQSDGRFQELLANYRQNLEQSVMQEQNKMVGRLGVKPMA